MAALKVRGQEGNGQSLSEEDERPGGPNFVKLFNGYLQFSSKLFVD